MKTPRLTMNDIRPKTFAERNKEYYEQKGVIVQDSPEFEGVVLFMLDRNNWNVKQNNRWWSHLLDGVMLWTSKEQAAEHCKKLKFNNPRVVTFKEAQEIEKVNESLIEMGERRKREQEAANEIVSYETKGLTRNQYR